MAKTPKRALAAVTDAGETVNGLLVRRITLGLAAMLERIGSPLVAGGGDKVTVGEMMASAFVLTRPAEESCRLLAAGRPEFDAKVAAWMDTLPPSAAKPLVAACFRAARLVADVSPSGADAAGGPEGNGNAAVTAG